MIIDVKDLWVVEGVPEVINMMVLFEGMEDYVPYTASAGDTGTSYSEKLYADAASGKYGTPRVHVENTERVNVIVEHQRMMSVTDKVISRLQDEYDAEMLSEEGALEFKRAKVTRVKLRRLSDSPDFPDRVTLQQVKDCGL